MPRSLSKKGPLPNGRPDRETMAFRYGLLKEVQRQVTPEIMAAITQTAIADAINGDADARNWISAYTLPKPKPEDASDLTFTGPVHQIVVNLSDSQLDLLADLDLDNTIDATVTDAHSDPQS